MKRIATWILFANFLFASNALAQCPQINDGFGVPQDNPYFISCTGGDFTIFIQSNDTLGNYSIDWGDGSPLTTGPGLVPPNFITHLYSATIDTFNISITDLSTGCVINGVVVLEEPVNASIQIPLGGVTQVCAPGDIDFVNSSTDVSPTTVFQWDFGDGSPIQTFDYTNEGDTMTHTYPRDQVDCETMVTLTAENYCSFGNPTSAQFFPIQIWDIDDAEIQASAILLCYPDTVVQLQNITDKNCFQEGNVAQRYEYWNFGDYWGLGYDSIINWQPFDPPARPGYTLAYPGLGSYDVMLIDSNICGRDTAYITIDIVPPPLADITISDDTICEGDQVTFFNQSSQGANNYFWNFDLGNGFQNLNGNNKTRMYNNSGDYDIFLVANIAGGSASCFDTANVPLHVLPSPTASFNLSDDEGCDSLTVQFTDNSTDAVTWTWDLGNGSFSFGPNPPNQTYTNIGDASVQLTVQHANGCLDSETQTISIYETPVAAFTPTNFCQNSAAVFTDQSTHFPNDPIINWSWDFGDGSTSTLQNPVNTYLDSIQYPIELIVSTAHCSDTLQDSLRVPPQPSAAFSMSDSAGCPALEVLFSDQSQGADTYFWQFGDGNTSSQSDPTYFFDNPTTTDTTYDVSLIVGTTFGCFDTAYQSVKVFGVSEASFTSNATPNCGPISVNFTDASNAATNWTWDF